MKKTTALCLILLLSACHGKAPRKSSSSTPPASSDPGSASGLPGEAGSRPDQPPGSPALDPALQQVLRQWSGEADGFYRLPGPVN